MNLIKGGLLLYTMARSIDLTQSTMPESIKLLGIAVVFGLDAALWAWDQYTADPYKARSDSQHKTGLLMIGANLIGVCAALIADSARILDPNGSRELIYTVSVYGIPVIILGNLIGMIAVNQADPDREEAVKEAEHDRYMTAIENDHAREMAKTQRETELAIEKLKHERDLKQARGVYFADDNHNGTLDPGEKSAVTIEQLAEMLLPMLNGKKGHSQSTMASDASYPIQIISGNGRHPKA